MQFILRERSGVGKGLADVLRVEVGKFLYHLCGRHAVGDEVHHVRHGDPKPADGGAPSQKRRERA